MKTLTSILLILFAWSLAPGQGAAQPNESVVRNEGAVTVICSPELMPLAGIWAEKFRQSGQGVKIDLVPSDEGGSRDYMERHPEGIAILTSKAFSSLNPPAAWNVVLGRNVTVAVMNVQNPLYGAIGRRGISAADWAQFFGTGAERDWGRLAGEGTKLPVSYYSLEDPTIRSEVQAFLKTSSVSFDGKSVTGGKELITAVAGDPAGLGFCRLSDLEAMKDQAVGNKVRIIPIDKNGNGQLDFMEDIYGSIGEFTRGVWIGKYPKALTNSIFATSLSDTRSDAGKAFLNWIITSGQNDLAAYGYAELVSGERQTQLDRITTTPVEVSKTERNTWATLRTILLVVLGFVIAGFIFDILGRYFRSVRRTRPSVYPPEPEIIDGTTFSVPKGVYYDKTHTWAFMEKDGTLRLGVDDFLPHVTGSIQRLELKAKGDRIKKGEILFTLIQKGKRMNVLSPVTGTITSTNNLTEEDPSWINRAPYAEGWIYAVEPVNWPLEMQFLSMAGQYSQWIKEEFSRFRDFLSRYSRAHSPELSAIALQDGGTVKEGILAEMGPQAWEDFQAEFLAGKH